MFYRTQAIIDEKLETSGKRLEVLEMDLRQREKEMDEAMHQRSAIEKEIHSMKLAAKGNKLHKASKISIYLKIIEEMLLFCT